MRGPAGMPMWMNLQAADCLAWGDNMMNTSATWISRYDAPGRSPFVFDLRAIGFFRILLALTILWDQLIRLGDWQAFHSAWGVVSLADSRGWGNPWTWSLYWLSDGPLLPIVLEALRGLATLTLLFGIRSRLSAFVLFVLLASLLARNPLMHQSGDRVLAVMTFFACFLPLGQALSLERLWFGGRRKPTCRSAGTAAFAIQVLLVWFMAGVFKTGEQWWSSGSAISIALHLEAFVSEFARLWRGWDWLVQPLTFFVFWLEILAPLLVLVPRYWCRLIGVLALAALEVGIWLSLEVGLFPLISMVSLIPLVPARFVDRFVGWWRRKGPPPSDLVLFYDRDCHFCLFACRLLLAVGGIRGAALREAQSDPAAARILEESFAWSVARVRGPERQEFPAELNSDTRQGWEAVRFLIAASRRPWLLRLLPRTSAGDRLYDWIGRNRGRFGISGRVVFGRAAPGRIGETGRFMASAALLVVLAWNLVTYPPLLERRDYSGYVEPLIALLNLQQAWTMFAPHPPTADFWHVVPALSRAGDRVDLLSGLPIDLEPPRDGPDRYGGYRWRKAIDQSVQRNEIARVFGYFCRTGKWAAMDLWEFSRPNLGNASTSQRTYEVNRLGRWRCGAADMDVVDAFRADVDRTMEDYRQGGRQRATHSFLSTEN